MINAVFNFESILKFHNRDIFAIRILALARSYGFKYDFAKFWVQKINGSITALISALDNNFSLSFSIDADETELSLFFSTIGFSTLCCSEEFKISRSFSPGTVMMKQGKVFVSNKYEVRQCSIGTLYEINKNYVEIGDYKQWYADVSHRIRHGTAKLFSLSVDLKYISVAAYSSCFEKYVILTHVATGNEYTKQGFGSFLLNKITSDENLEFFVMCNENENQHFYESIGFKNISKWRIYK